MIDFLYDKAIDYCDDVRDGTHDSPKHLKEGKMLVTSKNINNSELDLTNVTYISEDDYVKINERSKVDKNDILYSMIGTVGLVYRVKEEPNYAIKNLGLFKVKDEVKSKWLYYYLNSSESQNNVTGLLNGSTQKFISLSNLRNLQIKYPSDYYVMKKIVNVLDRIDNKILLNNKIKDNLLNLNEAFFEEKIKKGNDNRKNLLDIADIFNGYSYKGTELIECSKTGLLTIKNFDRSGGFKNDGFKDIAPEKIKETALVEMNDILVACTDLTQKAEIIGNPILLLNKSKYDKIVASMDLVKIIPKDKNLKYIIFQNLLNDEFKKYALGYVSGTTVLHLNKKCFSSYDVYIPSENNIEKFNEYFKTNYEKISQIISSNILLEELKQNMIELFVRGNVNVEDLPIFDD